jgi:cytochrome c-type biogenesis protein CcmH
MDPQEAQRVRRLEESMLAPCCWSDNVHTHQSEIAVQMRAEIKRMVAAGKSDREILDLYIARHGRRILVEPEGAGGSLLHWIPVVAIGLGLLWVVRVLIQWRRRAAREAAA